MKKPTLFSCLCILLFIHTGCEPSSSAESATRPNIVLIMADDMGYGDPGSYNPDSKIPTPNMDRLASEGMRFTDAHSPSAVCTPTRYGLLTGRYAWRTRLTSGVLWGYSPALIEPHRVTLASLLKSNGYATGGFGKWHLGLGSAEETDYSQPLTPGPVSVGFDYYYGIPASLDMDPYVYFENDRTVELPTDSTAASTRARTGGGGFWRAGPIAPGFKHADVLPVTTEKAVAFIDEEATNPDAPFFLYVSFSAPHTPWVPTEAFKGKSQAGPYGDFTAQVDGAVGQILDALDRHDLTDNTLVILTSDNGSDWIPEDIETHNHRSNLNWRGRKADIWEAGHRVPFIVRWPGPIPAESVSDETITHTDLMATFADLLEVELPAHAGEDSFNFLPVLLGKTSDKPVRETTIHHSLHGLFAVRQGDWKLVRGLGSGGFTEPQSMDPEPDGPQGQLYNLADDPAESDNLYQDHPELVEQLGAVLDQYIYQGYSRDSARRDTTWGTLFDGQSFDGWEGNLEMFRIEDGAIVGGTLNGPIPVNEFLCTTGEYTDFELRIQFKLLGGSSSNAGVQIRSSRIPNNNEVIGYQADIGEGWFGSLYDESRRNRLVATADPELIERILKKDDWNDYLIRAEGRRIRLAINGEETVDYTEPEDGITQTGHICLQIHSGRNAEVWYRNIEIAPVGDDGE